MLLTFKSVLGSASFIMAPYRIASCICYNRQGCIWHVHIAANCCMVISANIPHYPPHHYPMHNACGNEVPYADMIDLIAHSQWYICSAKNADKTLSMKTKTPYDTHMSQKIAIGEGVHLYLIEYHIILCTQAAKSPTEFYETINSRIFVEVLIFSFKMIILS